MDFTEAATGVTLANGTNAMTIGRYLVVTPMFTFAPANSTDAVESLASDNTNVFYVRNGNHSLVRGM